MFRFFLCRIVLPLAFFLFLSACAQNDVKTEKEDTTLVGGSASL